MAEELPELVVTDQAAWRAWLAEHAAQARGVWLVLAKKGTTEPTSLTYDQALEEALCQGWINVNPPGAFNAPHDHSSFALSGVYYASVPPEGRGGAIEFLDPRANANACTIEGAACFNRKFRIHPKPGNLLVFPSYLTHWVQPNGDSTDRVTVAFNIRYLKQSDPVPS